MGMTIAWASDLHLDMANNDAYKRLLDEFQKQKPDLLIVSGDTCEKMGCFDHLQGLQKTLGIPLYYILGNHDFYGSTIQEVKALASKYPSINYLTSGMVVPLGNNTALVGHDGWADAKSGNFDNIPLIPDFSQINDFSGYGKHQWKKIMQELGEESAFQAESTILKAFEKYSSLIFVTHSPPFREACLYEGHVSDDQWAPLFVNVSLGRMLHEIMENYPEKALTVYCGHTHHQCDYSPLPNLKVIVAHAEYGKPQAQKPIKIDPF